jgi:hypothetical protein
MPEVESRKRIIIPFYHGSFEFYAPYPSQLSSAMSLSEYDDFLSYINRELPKDVPGNLRSFRRFACITFSTIIFIVGLFLLIFLWVFAQRYEEDFVNYTHRVMDFLQEKNSQCFQRGLRFYLVDSKNEKIEHNVKSIQEDPYDICIAIDVLPVSEILLQSVAMASSGQDEENGT